MRPPKHCTHKPASLSKHTNSKIGEGLLVGSLANFTLHPSLGGVSDGLKFTEHVLVDI